MLCVVTTSLEDEQNNVFPTNVRVMHLWRKILLSRNTLSLFDIMMGGVVNLLSKKVIHDGFGNFSLINNFPRFTA